MCQEIGEAKLRLKLKAKRCATASIRPPMSSRRGWREAVEAVARRHLSLSFAGLSEYC